MAMHPVNLRHDRVWLEPKIGALWLYVGITRLRDLRPARSPQLHWDASGRWVDCPRLTIDVGVGASMIGSYSPFARIPRPGRAPWQSPRQSTLQQQPAQDPEHARNDLWCNEELTPRRR